MKQLIQVATVAGALCIAVGGGARADVVLGGPDSNDGSYSTAALQAAGGTAVTADGVTGVSLWAFLGGANAASPTSTMYGAITTSTPAGDNGKNAILRYYLVGTNSTGQQSVVSLGEIDPNFGGTSAPAPFVAYQTSGGSLLATPQLVVPNQPARNLNNLTNLQILAVPALTQGADNPSVQSTAVQLTGNVNAPASYTQTMLQNKFTAVQENIAGDVYTGVPLWTFLNPTSNGSTNQIVTVQATDGYEVAVALAELDTTIGGNPADLLPYADMNGTSFPADGVARTIFPTDNKQGRWNSNVDLITVQEAPEPASLTLLAVGLAGIGSIRRRFRRAA
jgi:hypothetical protein